MMRDRFESCCRALLLTLVLALALAACDQGTSTASPPGQGVSAGGTAGAGGDSAAVDAALVGVLALPRAHPIPWGGSFHNSLSCAFCHSNAPDAEAMRDAAGREVAPYDLWQASMMANAARDPLWRAVVSAEAAATPSRRDEIEAKCMRCHAPMAAVEAARGDGPPARLDLLGQRTVHGQLAMDGVSCALCHQIEPDRLGEAASFTGRFEVGQERVIYGPHDDLFAQPMVRRAGFEPRRGAHILSAGLCGSCHTLITEPLTPQGEVAGEPFIEQSVYLEWQNSVFNDEGEAAGARAQSCQGCHVPTTDEEGQALRARIARDPGGGDFGQARPRAPYGRHLFVGGNTLIPQILRDHPEVFNAPASAQAFDAVIARVREQLTQRTARVEVGALERTGDRLRVPVRLVNLTGHRFPAGHPSRRAWVRLVVRDGSGRVVFASGGVDAAGRLVGEGAEVLASERVGGPAQPHHQVIRDQGAVQVLEGVMHDPRGRVTYQLLRAARYGKDNRLLPEGWRDDHAAAAQVGPQGVEGDADFGGGGDALVYEVAAPAAAGPYEVEATLFYQTLGARYAAELFAHDTPEVRAFEALWRAADRAPEVVARATRLEGSR